MSFPKISIVTPSFNQGKYLEQTILSVLGQNYPNLEYFIIDGGSTDNSVEIIKKYESKITFWVSEKDGGMYEAIQKGFSRSTGDIMAWINSDDMYHKNAFNNVAKVFNAFPEIKWLQGNPTTFDRSGELVLVRPLRRWSKYNYYTGDHEWIQQESTFWKRSLWEMAGGSLNTAMRFAGDYDLWLRFFRHEKLYVSNMLLGGFRISNENQLSSGNLQNYLKELNETLLKEVLDQKSLKQIAKIKGVKKIMYKTSRINIGSLKLKYHRLFEYPPQVVFNVGSQKFELKEADGYTY